MASLLEWVLHVGLTEEGETTALPELVAHIIPRRAHGSIEFFVEATSSSASDVVEGCYAEGVTHASVTAVGIKTCVL